MFRSMPAKKKLVCLTNSKGNWWHEWQDTLQNPNSWILLKKNLGVKEITYFQGDVSTPFFFHLMLPRKEEPLII
jgi:hypothetical protein